MNSYIPIIRKLETPGRLTVKLTKEIVGLLVTLDGDENEIAAYLKSWSENGIEIEF
ncbi:hypothetical protein [uncultured Flavobacterium sp.]|uniref:hypothetical protein n=1 Tax=uncultured Flavobacterium sp. TaxID=165435 RepID=UPI0030818BF2